MGNTLLGTGRSCAPRSYSELEGLWTRCQGVRPWWYDLAMPVCSVCQRANPDTHNFCGGCGGKLPRPLGPGTVLEGRYEVERVLSESGGFATTYLISDQQLFGKQFVLKELRPEQTTPKSIALFDREARILAALNLKQVPKLHARFVSGGKFYLVQDFIPGETWGARSRRMGPCPEEEVRQTLTALLDILDALHRHNPPIIHRDIKPDNLILDPDGNLHLIDFGAVREAVLGPGAGTVAASTIIYTEGFAPPEQLAGTVLPSSDLYAAGATAIGLLASRHPREMYDGAKGVFYLPSGITQGFRDILNKLLAYQTKDRYQNAHQAIQALSGQGAKTTLETWEPIFEGLQPIGQLLAGFHIAGRAPLLRIKWEYTPPLEQGVIGKATSPVLVGETLFWSVEERVTSGFSYFPRIVLFAMDLKGNGRWNKVLGGGTTAAKGLASPIPSPYGILVQTLETAQSVPWWIAVDGTENLGPEGLAHVMACLDPADGSFRWKSMLTDRVGLQIHEGFSKTPPLIIGNQIRCGFSNRICTIHAVDGTLIESLLVQEQINGLHAIGEGRAFVTLGKFVLEAVELVDPTIKRWVFRPRTQLGGVMVSPDGIALGTKDGMLRVIDPSTGSERWAVNLGKGAASAAAIDGMTLVAANWDGQLKAFDMGTGTVRWSADFRAGNAGSPAISAGTVVVAGDQCVAAFDLATGKKRWEVEIPGKALPGTSPLLGDAVVYVPTSTGLVAIG